MKRLGMILVVVSMITWLAPDAGWAQGAVDTLRSLTAGNGLYSNRIAAATFVPPRDYTEVCVVGGQVAFDIKLAGQSTAGGNCLPGNVGWLIERDEQAAANWEMARMRCLENGMRFPEPFEWKFSCKNAALFGLDNMVDDFEFASNVTAVNQSNGGTRGVRTAVFGEGSCADASWAAVGNDGGGEAAEAFRCVR